MTFETIDRSRSTLVGIAVFCGAASFYVTSLLGALVIESLVGRAVLGGINGLAIGLLFIVGHDACHGSLTPSKRMNAIFGRVAFLPSLHPFTAWAYSHNALHHVWTNLKGRDPVYAPLTVQEYRRLSAMRRLMARLERSIPGVGLLYFHTIWWRCEINPDRETSQLMARQGPVFWDRFLLICFLMTETIFIVWLASIQRVPTPATIPEALLFGIVLPFAVWNWLMGFITFQHHTHPSIPWFEKREEWTWARGQIDCTAHIVFPKAINVLLLYIMEHTAHHLNPLIPLYRLQACQASLDSEVRHFPWSMRHCLDTFRKCKLYDFERHQWQDFEGNPTSQPDVNHSWLVGLADETVDNCLGRTPDFQTRYNSENSRHQKVAQKIWQK